MTTDSNELWLLTGPRGVGKTRFCQNLIQFAKDKDLSVNGLICPPGFTGDTKTAIHLLDLNSGKQRLLARVKTQETNELTTDHWIFDPQVLEWGNQLLADIPACDLLIIDELGPLEFKRGQGWQNAFKALEVQNYRAAVVVIRPELLVEAQTRWKNTRILEIPPDLDEETEKELLGMICHN